MMNDRQTTLESAVNSENLQTAYVQENLVSDWRDMQNSQNRQDSSIAELPNLLLSDASATEQNGVRTEVNEFGDEMEINDEGQITKFTYATGESYEMKYDENGEVVELKCPNGDVYYKVTDGFFSGSWSYKNEQTGEEDRTPNPLGQITVDQNGIVIENPGGPILPERE